jgi:NADP-dependent 3-hydroxy acid dehydrogenase YdfG
MEGLPFWANNVSIGIFGGRSNTRIASARRLFDVNLTGLLELTPTRHSDHEIAVQWHDVQMGSADGPLRQRFGVRRVIHPPSAKRSMRNSSRPKAMKPIRVTKVAPGVVDIHFHFHVINSSAPDNAESIRRVVSLANIAQTVASGHASDSKNVPPIARLFLALECL